MELEQNQTQQYKYGKRVVLKEGMSERRKEGRKEGKKEGQDKREGIFIRRLLSCMLSFIPKKKREEKRRDKRREGKIREGKRREEKGR